MGTSSLAAILIGAALVVALIGGFGSGSILGALLAFGGACVAAFGLWKGTQEEKQTRAAVSMLLLLGGLGLAGLLVILKIVDWLR